MIRPANEKDYAEVAEVWEASVRATHHFLPEDYLQKIKSLLPSIFASIPMLVDVDDGGQINGFIGVAENKIEMLFIRPSLMGKGIGKALMKHAIENMKAYKVEVNEHNQEATRFYLHAGFVQTGRTELDGLGKPFPILQMEIRR